MTERVSWQDKYAIVCHQNASGAAYEGATFTAGSTGVDADAYALMLNNHPDLNTGFGVDTRTLANNGVSINNFDLDLIAPKFTIEFDATLKMLGLFSWLLCQGGVSEGAGSTYTKTITQATYASAGSSCEVWASFLRLMAEGSTAESLVAHGCVCSDLTITGVVGGVVKCSATMVARNVVNDFNAGSAILNFSNDDPLLFQSCSFARDGSNPSDISSFTIKLTNNLTVEHKSNDSRLCSGYRLGMLTSTLDIVVPWSADAGGNSWQNSLEAGTAFGTICTLIMSASALIAFTNPRIVSAQTIDDGGVVSLALSMVGTEITYLITDSVNRLP